MKEEGGTIGKIDFTIFCNLVNKSLIEYLNEFEQNEEE